ncbi:hypothetical protein HMPREF3036_00569 [Sutterella sp. KLE1602]|nr:hypothetical protein HMPREF3036_00569 [Sutterella sp. KLE1602]
MAIVFLNILLSLRKWFRQPSDWRPFFNHTRTLRPMTMILI